MSPLPAVCSACRHPFAESGTSHRLAVLEGGRAFCSDCLWRIDHPEADLREHSSPVLISRQPAGRSA